MEWITINICELGAKKWKKKRYFICELLNNEA